MNSAESNERSAAIEGFVDRLAQIRSDAGDPSFRKMAKRSGVISHATMHDAVQGVRMPSWETTVEFAQACGVDPDELRQEWEQADAIVHPPEEEGTNPAEDAAAPAAGGEPDPEDAAVQPPAATEASPLTAAASTQPSGVNAAAASAAPAAPDPDPAPSSAPAAASTPAASTVDAPSPEAERTASSSGHKRLLAGIGIGAALALVAALAVQQLRDDPAEAADTSSTPTASSGSSAGPASGSYPAAPSGVLATTDGADGCPTNAEGMGEGEPRRSGDSGAFSERGFSDCSLQKRGERISRTFVLKNEGTVPWVGRKLVRIQPERTNAACTLPMEAAIPTAQPGESVEVELTMTTPTKPAVCFGRWMQLEQDGQWAFPGQRPYFVSFKVE